MTNGVLLYAHNSRDIDYAQLSLISGGLAKKNLEVPVSLITDESTVDWMKQSKIYNKAVDIFDKIILQDRPELTNYRNLRDLSAQHKVPFINQTRSSAFKLSPYEKTLLIDSDYFVLSDTLSEYWNINQSVIMPDSAKDINYKDRMKYLDRYISETGIKMYWATAVMFTKNEEAKTFFELADCVRENYETFANLFRFCPLQFRNDIAFSVAKHIMNGFEKPKEYTLPSLLTSLDRDSLDHVSDTKLNFLIEGDINGKYYPVSIKNCDIHIMNKKSITRNYENLVNLI